MIGSATNPYNPRMRDPLQAHVDNTDAVMLDSWRQKEFEAKFGHTQAAFLLQEKYVAPKDNTKKHARQAAQFEKERHDMYEILLSKKQREQDRQTKTLLLQKRSRKIQEQKVLIQEEQQQEDLQKQKGKVQVSDTHTNAIRTRDRQLNQFQARRADEMREQARRVLIPWKDVGARGSLKQNLLRRNRNMQRGAPKQEKARKKRQNFYPAAKKSRMVKLIHNSHN